MWAVIPERESLEVHMSGPSYVCYKTVDGWIYRGLFNDVVSIAAII
jgi:hypothetical protein